MRRWKGSKERGRWEVLGWQKGWLARSFRGPTESDGTTEYAASCECSRQVTTPRIIVAVRKQALGALGARKCGSRKTQS